MVLIRCWYSRRVAISRELSLMMTGCRFPVNQRNSLQWRCHSRPRPELEWTTCHASKRNGPETIPMKYWRTVLASLSCVRCT